MTLVIAGYKQTEFLWDPPINYIPDRTSGIFMVADSIISTVTASVRKPLVSEFRKIVELPVNVWEPYFIGGNFHGYKKIFTTYKCLVAFAGSTLTAQHIINNISGHLANLRIDYEEGNEFKCIVRKSCDENNLIKNGSSNFYSEDVFVQERDYQNLVNAQFVSDVVEHSINKALDSKMRHVLDEDSLNAMRTEILFGITCPVEEKDYLYKYAFMTRYLVEGGVEAYCNKTLIQANDIRVIGMESTYGVAARAIANASFSSGIEFQENITQFVVQSIAADTTYEIGFPVAIKSIKGNHLTSKYIRE
jgi:hypothetical protein